MIFDPTWRILFQRFVVDTKSTFYLYLIKIIIENAYTHTHTHTHTHTQSMKNKPCYHKLPFVPIEHQVPVLTLHVGSERSCIYISVFEISGSPIVKTNLTLIRTTSIPRIVSRLTTKYFLSVRAHVNVGGWILSYPLSILKVIFLEGNPLWFIQTLISFIRAYVYTCPTKIKQHCIYFS